MIEEFLQLKEGAVYSWHQLTKHYQHANLVIVNGKTIKDRWFPDELRYTNLKPDTKCTARWYKDIQLLKVTLVTDCRDILVTKGMLEDIFSSMNLELVFEGKFKPKINI